MFDNLNLVPPSEARRLADAASPLIPDLLNPAWSLVRVNPGLPVPPLREVLNAGFDAIVQARDDAFEGSVRRLLQRCFGSVLRVAYDHDAAPSAMRAIVDEALGGSGYPG